MLTLTEDRAGVGGWTLFAIQVPIIIGLAWLSATFFERPLRYAKAKPGDHRFVMAMASTIVLVIGGAVLLSQRTVETDLAGLGEADAAPSPRRADEPARVLVVADELGAPLLGDLTGPDTEIEVVETLDFVCRPSSGRPGCDWAPWADAVHEHDPDIVLFHVTDWDADELAAVSRSDDASEQVSWLTATLSEGMATLSSKGAAVAWSTAPADTVADAIRAESAPLGVAMTATIRQSPSYHDVGVVYDPDRLVQDLALYRRTTSTGGPRILVVGDSLSRNLGSGYPLNRPLPAQAALQGRATGERSRLGG